MFTVQAFPKTVRVLNARKDLKESMIGVEFVLNGWY